MRRWPALLLALFLTGCPGKKTIVEVDAGPGFDAGVILTPMVECQPCATHADCNPSGGSGNFCLGDPSGLGACGMACSSSADCATGFSCFELQDSTGATVGANCARTDRSSCFGTTSTTVDREVLCHPCNSSVSCNPSGGANNFCLPDPSGPGACGIACNSAADCPIGFACFALTNRSGTLMAQNCFVGDGGSCFADAAIPSDAGPKLDGAEDAGPPAIHDGGLVGGLPDASPGCTADRWSTYAAALVADHCVSCHPDYTAYTTVRTHAEAILREVSGRTMPPGAPLSTEEIIRFGTWIDCGAPE